MFFSCPVSCTCRGSGAALITPEAPKTGFPRYGRRGRPVSPIHGRHRRSTTVFSAKVKLADAARIMSWRCKVRGRDHRPTFQGASSNVDQALTRIPIAKTRRRPSGVRSCAQWLPLTRERVVHQTHSLHQFQIPNTMMGPFGALFSLWFKGV